MDLWNNKTERQANIKCEGKATYQTSEGVGSPPGSGCDPRSRRGDCAGKACPGVDWLRGVWEITGGLFRVPAPAFAEELLVCGLRAEAHKQDRRIPDATVYLQAIRARVVDHGPSLRVRKSGMGEIFKAECPCGFKSRDLYVGRGMMNAHPYGVPVACPQCHIVWVTYSRSHRRTCRKCKATLYYLHEDGNFVPADVLKRFKVDFPWDWDCTEEEVESFPEVRYRCPKCGKIEMQLVEAGCWD
ncbi:MAG: hypothetical protein KKE37_08610 [Verrucomicrobia bacterium]|nr:hypothetical protein [Verrucomicrobiota bacterium]MBU4290152.1 hypothetical protein [Verrucomicrobiota bacterium]MBU4429397.1 hypothetical protein [Verrucomicrobiota bacterium]MCG2681444.1 hypothetical protein [Kiritimatiellia bacterium]